MKIYTQLKLQYNGRSFKGKGVVGMISKNPWVWLRLMLNFFWLKLTTDRVIIENYYIKKTFNGWPKRFYGRTLRVEVTGIKKVSLRTGEYE